MLKRPPGFGLRHVLGALCCLCVLCVFVVGSSAEDWAYWRGPLQNGVSPDKDLPESFSSDPSAPNSNVIWKVPYGGRTAPIVLGNWVYIINAVGSDADSTE